jgi:hypothetical protein
MKAYKASKSAAICLSAAAIVAAGYPLILGYHRQAVCALKVDAFAVHRVPYKYQQCQHRRVKLGSSTYVDQNGYSRRSGMTRMSDRKARACTLLCMSTGRGGDEAESSTLISTPKINVPLVAQNLGNQALLGSQIWTGGTGFVVLSEQSNFGIVALILGTLGVIPMLALSRAIETSESPFVSGLNLSTNMAVLRLFGPTSQPITAFFVSFVMAATTGIVEETLFRAQSKFFLPK